MKRSAKTPVVSIVGVSNSGKTTFIVKLIGELKSRGYRVASIKHASHGFDIDRPGKDSFRHTEAGAEAVIVASKDKVAMVMNIEQEMHFEDIVALFGNEYDIVLSEGYRSYPLPKIEVLREGFSKELISPVDELLAVVTDSESNTIADLISNSRFNIDSYLNLHVDEDSRLDAFNAKPRFKSDDVVGVAVLIEKMFLR